jgi:hypothetical protein
VFLVNSRQSLVTATPLGFASELLHLPGAHLLPKLRCQFAEFLNEGSLKRLGILSLPTCVGLRYGHLVGSLEAFLGSMGSASLLRKADPHHLSALNGPTDLPVEPAYGLEPGHPSPGWPTLLRPPIAQAPTRWYRNINLFPITYAFRPRLRGRLTLGGLTFPRKPWASGDAVSHGIYRYSCQHNHFQGLQQSFRSAFTGNWNAPLPPPLPEARKTRSFGSMLEPRYIFGADPLDQ